MSVRIVPTLSGEDVTTYSYDLLFPMIGPAGEEEYRLEFRFNQRMDRWVLSIYNSDDTVIVRGAPVVLGVNLLTYAVPALAPRGYLITIWKAEVDSTREPGEKDLGAWCEMLYFERSADLDTVEPTEPPRA